MKINLKKIVLVLFASVFFAVPSYAQTKFINYKNYSIPINTSAIRECDDGRPRVIVTTDMNGLRTNADPDDLQSMVHLLASSNRVVIKGLISTPFTSPINVDNAKDHITNLIKAYEHDYDRSNPAALTALGYPRPADLFSVVRQGVDGDLDTRSTTYNAANSTHQGAKLILDEAQAILNGTNCGPLHVLVWGAIPDLTLALKESDRLGLGIEKVLRVYAIGSSNRTSTSTRAASFDDIRRDFLDPDRLWFILSDRTFRGAGEVNLQRQENFLNTISNNASSSSQSCMSYVLRRASDELRSRQTFWLKIGDSPSFFHVIDPSWSLDNQYPSSSNWGGQYVLKPGNTQYWVDGPRGSDSVEEHMIPSVYVDWKVSMDRFTKLRSEVCRRDVRDTIPD